MKYKVIIRQKAEKQLNKQNFVKGKITKYECISFAIYKLIRRSIFLCWQNCLSIASFLSVQKNVVDQPQVVGFAAMSNPTKIKKKKHSNMKKYLLIKISKK